MATIKRRRRQRVVSPPTDLEVEWLLRAPPPAYLFLPNRRQRCRELWETFGAEVLEHYRKRGQTHPRLGVWLRLATPGLFPWERTQDAERDDSH